MRFFTLLACLALAVLPSMAQAATINRMTVDYANGSYLRFPSNYVLARALAANTAESITVPTDDATGKKARSVVFSSTCTALYANTVTTATVPGDTTDGSASVHKPVGYYLGGAVTTISLITPDTAGCVVTAEFFM